MELYIDGIGILGATWNSASADFPGQPLPEKTDRLMVKEPDYTGFIPAMQLRRMSKAVRMGIGAARICLQDAGLEKPDAISIGTAFGCLHDTEVFLSKMVTQDEQMLTPTAFIQSTHNTVAGQIALVTGCYGHNLTFVHRGHSFEQAMVNAQLYLNDHTTGNIMVGGIEELTESSIEVLKMARVYRTAPADPREVLTNPGEGALAGEGANFFLVRNQRTASSAMCIKDIYTFVANDSNDAAGLVSHWVKKTEGEAGTMDMVFLGTNGNSRDDLFYGRLRNDLFENIKQETFKQFSGEYPVASSYGLGLLSAFAKRAMREGDSNGQVSDKTRQVLMINNFLNHYSCWHIDLM